MGGQQSVLVCSGRALRRQADTEGVVMTFARLALRELYELLPPASGQDCGDITTAPRARARAPSGTSRNIPEALYVIASTRGQLVSSPGFSAPF